MNRFRKVLLLLLLIGISFGVLSGVRAVSRAMDREIRDGHLRFTGQIRNAPPLVAFTTVALGSFRGLVADLLWLRTSSLQEKRNYFEMAQLARWITDLQPSFAGAAAFLAWNMAYNISVTCSDFEERWRWVNEGIRLLRDQAIPYNPEEPRLYRELSYFFQHKLGNVMDDANLYYKNKLGAQMMGIFGSSPDWSSMAAAPPDEKAFLETYPAGCRFWRLASAAGYPDYPALWAGFRQSAPELPEKLAQALAADPELSKKIRDYLRSELLRQQFRLDPRLILALNEKYGALDWRVPESQAIYWATEGIRHSRSKVNLDCDRAITQALQDSFRYGRLLALDTKEFNSIQVVPNLGIVDAVYQAYLDKEMDNGGREHRYSTFRSARIVFVKEAISILYNYGQFKKAEEYFKLLIKEDGPQAQNNLEDFVMEQWAETIRNSEVRTANEIISGLIFRSINFAVYGDTDAALASERMARYLYRTYMKESGAQKRMRLLPYPIMKQNVLNACMKTYPPAMAELLKTKIAAELGEAASEKQQKETK